MDSKKITHNKEDFHVKKNEDYTDYLNNHTYFEGEDVKGDNDYYEDLVNQGGTMIIKLQNLDFIDDLDDEDLMKIVNKKQLKTFKKKLGANLCDILYNEAHQNPLFNSKTKKGTQFRTALQTKMGEYC